MNDSILPHPKHLSSDVPVAGYAEHMAVEMASIRSSPDSNLQDPALASTGIGQMSVHWRRRQQEFTWTQVKAKICIPSQEKGGRMFIRIRAKTHTANSR